MPNGKKPRNHATMTATTSLWGIFSVINDCKPKTKSNLGIIDGDIKKCGISHKKVSAYFIWSDPHFRLRKFKGRHLFGVNKGML